MSFLETVFEREQEAKQVKESVLTRRSLKNKDSYQKRAARIENSKKHDPNGYKINY